MSPRAKGTCLACYQVSRVPLSKLRFASGLMNCHESRNQKNGPNFVETGHRMEAPDNLRRSTGKGNPCQWHPANIVVVSWNEENHARHEYDGTPAITLNAHGEGRGLRVSRPFATLRNVTPGPFVSANRL